MCIDLERWGAMDEVVIAVNRSERTREDELRALLDQVPVLDEHAPREEAPAIR